MTIDEARAIITKAFADGDTMCRSCGWWGLESEHNIWDEDIQEAINGDGIIHLNCVSKDDDGGEYAHRGSKIYLRES